MTTNERSEQRTVGQIVAAQGRNCPSRVSILSPCTIKVMNFVSKHATLISVIDRMWLNLRVRPLARLFAATALMSLFACVPSSSEDGVTRAVSDITSSPQALETASFQILRPMPPVMANADIQDAFVDLAFQLESGKTLDRLSRFEGTVKLRLLGPTPDSLRKDLSQLLHRLRSEALIDIQLVDSTSDYNITIQSIERRKIQEYIPHAACFVAVNVNDIDEYAQYRGTERTSWSYVNQRQKATMFIPNDTSAQEIRDCLNEELAQALGPLNDLYRLSDSVFNDDNMHTVLTGFDMLVLRAFYDPALSSGMTRAEVEAILPSVLRRLNPVGETLPSRGYQPTPRAWSSAIAAAMGPGSSVQQRQDAARKALQIAAAAGWNDHRRAYSHYVKGRVTALTSPSKAQHDFLVAYDLFSSIPNSKLHRAYVAPQIAGYALAAGDAGNALKILNEYQPVAERHQNAALLSQIMMIRAEAMELSGRATEARSIRLDSLGWARYAFGSQRAVNERLAQVARLNPLNK